MSQVNVANHVLESILKDLSFLKDNDFLPNQTYKDVVAMLPHRITMNHSNAADTSRPPLPTRKLTSTAIAQPGEMPSFPKLPERRTHDLQLSQSTQQQQAPQQLLAMVMPSMTKNIMHSEPAPSSFPPPPPPAYTQKPTMEPPSLATAEALYDYRGEDASTDLSFKQGDMIEVTEYVNDDWWKGTTVNGKSGIFPQNHVKKIPPPIKAKRPWVPPILSLNTPPTNNTTTTMPYSYPPPPKVMYTPPPPQTMQAYAQPPAVVINNNEQQQHGQEEGGGDKKVHNMAKKFGGNLATAATWGFGATLGSQAASAIF